MKSKNILLAGLAVGVLAAATGAHALTLSGSTIGGVAITGNPTAATVNPYYIAQEATLGAGFTGTAVFDTHLVTGTLSSGQYLVTYAITGASFNTAGLTGANLTYVGSAGSTQANVSTFNSSSISFVVTLGAGDLISDFKLTIPVVVTAVGSVSLTESVTQAGNPIDNSPVTAMVAGFAQGYAATVTGATNQVASIASGFTLFKANPGPGADVSSANIGTITTLVATAPGTAAAGSPFKNLTGGSAVIGDITGVNVTITGGVGSTETVTVGGTAVATGTATGLSGNGAKTVTLNQTGAVPLQVSTYSAVATPVLNGLSGLTPSLATPGAGNLGAVSYEGVNFNAAWVGDGVTNASQDYRIRIGNTGTAIVKAVTVTLRNPSLPVSQPLTCQVAAGIAANSTITIKSSDLRTCFGNFGNSDMVITVQANAANLSAKMRVINSLNSLVTEQSLGFGTTVAQQQ